MQPIRFSAKLSGMNPDEEIRFISYGDYGMDLYSNGMIIPKAMAADEPEMVKGMLWAINQGVKDTLADLDEAVESVAPAPADGTKSSGNTWSWFP